MFSPKNYDELNWTFSFFKTSFNPVIRGEQSVDLQLNFNAWQKYFLFYYLDCLRRCLAKRKYSLLKMLLIWDWQIMEK